VSTTAARWLESTLRLEHELQREAAGSCSMLARPPFGRCRHGLLG
jgi:hypothetical protein